jgi:hypothetical protein
MHACCQWPTVQDGREAHLGSEPLRIGRQCEQALGSGSKEQIVEACLIAEHQRMQGFGQGEDDVEIGDG